MVVGSHGVANYMSEKAQEHLFGFGSVAGMGAGLLWALLAGYFTRLVSPQLRGRAIAVAMAGTPLALSVGALVGGLSLG
ncbi:hypothetical protein SDC9_176119 [bioreactor metagenome]|uniref:Major facilitator superfamily (MFS) profile domain-containing protein n=1 Tax=bioreactor metagenome TaxID=1076179 RepID=A0A645GPN7_9ZZZZ